MVGDSIANLINSLKNASHRGLATASFPYTKMQEAILSVLKKEGFIVDFEKKGKDIKKSLEVTIKYANGVPAINDTKRVSKFSRRVYKDVKSIYPIKNGYGLAVFSTPKGVMSDREAKKANVGGEALFEIW